MNEPSIDRVLQERGILVTCGTGGVGKTTLSAALALRAAILGKRTVVITIDPAKRLATSLGLSHLGDEPSDLTPHLQGAFDRARDAGLSLPSERLKGTLAAIVPDTRLTFETFVRELSPSEAVANRVMTNPIFQIFAKEFSGTNEYMALERVYSLQKSGKYDCIILDTPPSRNTLAFLDAPKLLARFFEDRLIRWLVLPANKIVSTGMKKALGLLEKLTGAGFMTNLFDFASALFEVRVAFSANLKKVTELLESPRVGFIMVTVPAPGTVPEILHFIETLDSHRFHFDGVAMNRTLGYLELKREERAPSEPGLERAYSVLRGLQTREESVMAALQAAKIPLSAKLPELSRDVHSVEDLFHVAMALGQPDSRRTARP